MPYSPDFDVDAILRVLERVNAKYPEGTPEDEALRVAAVALLYVRETRKLDDYREFFRKFYTPAVDYVIVSQKFATREDADAWLSSGAATDGALVSIAGQGFSVVKLPNRWEFLRTPLPEELGRPK